MPSSLRLPAGLVLGGVVTLVGCGGKVTAVDDREPIAPASSSPSSSSSSSGAPSDLPPDESSEPEYGPPIPDYPPSVDPNSELGVAQLACAKLPKGSWPDGQRVVAESTEKLTQLLTGRWYMCKDRTVGETEYGPAYTLFGADNLDGYWFQASGAMKYLDTNPSGSFFAYSAYWASSLTWQATSSKDFTITFEGGNGEYWAVFSADGNAALIVDYYLPSNEFYFVRVPN